MIERREFLGLAAIALVPGCAMTTRRSMTLTQAYGLIGQMKCAPGKRAEVLAALVEGTAGMPGNLAYLIGEDLADPESIWITEVWESREAHAASLKLPAVQAAIAKARPHIAGFGTRVETRPVVKRSTVNWRGLIEPLDTDACAPSRSSEGV